MGNYVTPGVYHERFDASAPKINPLRTDIAAFVGIAERGPLDTPIPVESLRQFESHFGGPIPQAFLALVVRAFFENNGRRCWIVRVAGGSGGADAIASLAKFPTIAGQAGLEFHASSPGVWGDELSIALREVCAAQSTLSQYEDGAISSVVASVGGFQRHTFVRLRQTTTVGTTDIYRIVSGVNAVERQLIWYNDDSRLRLSTDKPLSGLSSGSSVLVEAITYEILVYLRGRLIHSVRDLSLAPQNERYIASVLDSIYESSDDGIPQLSVGAPRLIRVFDTRADFLAPIAPAVQSLAGGADGLESLSPYDFTGEQPDPHGSGEIQKQQRRGIWALDVVDEVSLVAVPDIHCQPATEPEFDPLICPAPDPCLFQSPVSPATTVAPVTRASAPTFTERAIYQVQAELIAHCETRYDRFALLDPPLAMATGGAAGLALVRSWRQQFETKFAALYWPWVEVRHPKPTSESLTLFIPPCGHVAGCFAVTDVEVGVHKAPANRALNWVDDVSSALDDAGHGVLNPLGINAIRVFPGRGIRVFGARTLSSDPDARFVNVRRLILMVMKAARLSMQWATFEPNNTHTRSKVRLSLISYLTALWQSGALVGDIASAAFFVRCDETNNPVESREIGRLIADVGIAPSVPYEFVVLRIGRVEDAIDTYEPVMGGASA